MLANHTMSANILERYLTSKVHPKADKSRPLIIRPEFNPDVLLGFEKKRLFNYMRPTLDVETNTLYAFPGVDYIEHYSLIYKQLGYEVELKLPNFVSLEDEVSKLIPNLPVVDIITLGYVEIFTDLVDWRGNDFVKYQVKTYGHTKVAFVGVAFSYWGDISEALVRALAKYTDSFIYFGKLGSMLPDVVPNKYLATGNFSFIQDLNAGFEFESPFNSQDFQQVIFGDHITLSSPVKETKAWVEENLQFQFVDTEIGLMAKACADTGKQFSYLHLISNSLVFDFEENLSFEPKYSREAALLLGKSLIINYFYNYPSKR